MKTTSKYFMCTICIVLSLALHSFAQSEQPSYQVNKSKPLIQVLEDLKKNYGLEFSYPSELIKNHIVEKSNYKFDNLNQLIKSILNDSNIDFKIIENRKVLLRPKRPEKETSIKYTKTNTFKVSGIIQNETGQPLPFVNVVLDTLFIGSSSDDSGYFEFNIPRDFSNRNISFHLVGYSTVDQSIKKYLINPVMQLVPSVVQMNEVLLVEKIKAVEINTESSSTKNQAEYLNKIIAAPIISNDINRSLQMISGVDATNDLKASVRIRGSQDDETLMIVDGIPIYKADHYYGIFGAINGNHINTVALHKNSLPIEYGGKTGGMVEMKSRDYFTKVSGLADLNMLTTSITLSAPIDDHWGIIVSGRTTYDNAADSKIFNWIEPSPEEDLINNQLSDRPLLLNTTPVIKFFDLNGKLSYRPNDRHLFGLSVFNSEDKFDNAYDITFSNPQVTGTINGQEALNDSESWRNFGLSIQSSSNFNNNWILNNTIYHSLFDYSGALNTSLRLDRNGNEFFINLTNQKNNMVQDWGFQSILSKKLKTDKLSFGLSVVHHDLEFGFQADNTRNFDINKTGVEGALFSMYNWNVSSDWALHLGGRMDYYSETDQVYFAPRMSTSFAASENLTLKGSFSKNYQFLREVTFYSRLREPLDIFLLTSDGKKNRTYPVGSSVNSMLGITYQKDKWTVDLELYNKDMNGVIEHTETLIGQDVDDIKTPSRTNHAITGTGRVIGADFSLGYESKAYTAGLAYTLSKMTNRFEELFRNAAIPSEDDRRHQLKFTNQLSLGQWSLTGNYVFASGRNQLNLFDQSEPVNLQEVLKNETYTSLDPYHRLDLGVSHGLEIAGRTASIGLSVFNLTNNKNVDYIQYLFAVPTRRNNVNRNVLTGTTTKLLDRTLNLTFKVEW